MFAQSSVFNFNLESTDKNYNCNIICSNPEKMITNYKNADSERSSVARISLQVKISTISLPRRGFLCREGQKNRCSCVRTVCVPPSLPPYILCHARSARNQQICGKVIGRILNSNLVYNVKIRHPSTCDDLVLRTQKVALGPPLPCGCNLV